MFWGEKYYSNRFLFLPTKPLQLLWLEWLADWLNGRGCAGKCESLLSGKWKLFKIACHTAQLNHRHHHQHQPHSLMQNLADVRASQPELWHCRGERGGLKINCTHSNTLTCICAPNSFWPNNFHIHIEMMDKYAHVWNVCHAWWWCWRWYDWLLA